MAVTCDPPIDNWQPAFGRDIDRRELARLLRGGSGRALDRVVATGHQAWLWHPGILAKDLAVAAAARRFDAAAVHVVVDHDAHEALSLALPVVTGDTLEVFELTLGDDDPRVPTGCRPPADVSQVVALLRDAGKQLGATLAVDLAPIIDAYEHVGECRTLAEQTAAVVAQLAQPYTGETARLFSSALGQLDGFRQLVQRMVTDARSCAAGYNRAVHAFADAGVAALVVAPQRVELPLWLLDWQRPRRRVFADLSGDRPELIGGDGQAIDRQATLAPKALLLTAVLRHLVCDLFVHGHGGAVYDRVTEQWCADWLGHDLAPRATVSADVLLPLDVPVAQRDELQRALWRRHHLRHNLDRDLQLTGPAVQRKGDLIAHMDDDRDPLRRRRAFEQIHQINDQLAQQHRDVLDDADRQAARARSGVNNRRLALKRDWCFGLYPPGRLHQLAAAFS